LAFFVRINLLLRFIVVNFKQSPFLYAKFHKKVGIGPIPDPPVALDDYELAEREQEDLIEWGWLEDDAADKDEDYSNNSNKFLLIWGWNSLLTLCGCCMTFFVCFYLLLGFKISEYILYVSGKKRERSDESEEEVDQSSNKDKKENWKKNYQVMGKI
jgi:hypothetical protein